MIKKIFIPLSFKYISQNKIIQNNLDVLEMLKYTIAAIATFGSGSSALSSQAVSGQAWFAGASKQYGL
jgi:hypothetical protein